MQKLTLIVLGIVLSFGVSYAQSFTETFDSNSLGWTECAYDSADGTSIIDNGAMYVKSKGVNKAATVAVNLMGVSGEIGRDTFFETHCYAPLDVKKPFEIVAHVTIDKLAKDKTCGLIFNYKDIGNFYGFTLTSELVNFQRFEDRNLVGGITQGVMWDEKRKIDQEWKLVSDGDEITFYLDGMQVMRVKYMPLEYSGFGFYTFGKQQLRIDDVTFTQL